MRYTQDAELKRRFLDAVLKTEEVGTGRAEEQQSVLPIIHVSELITSVVNSWFKRMGHKEVFSERSRESMAAGVGMQGALRLPFLENEVTVRSVLYPPRLEPFTDFYTPFAELVGHVDGVEGGEGKHPIKGLFFGDFEVNSYLPWELKLTAGGIKYPPGAHYLEQLATYALMLGSKEGRLVTFHRSERGDELFKVGTVEWDQDELDSWWEEITRRAYLLVNSPEPPWGEEYKWMEGYYSLPDGVQREKSGTYTGWFGAAL